MLSRKSSPGLISRTHLITGTSGKLIERLPLCVFFDVTFLLPDSPSICAHLAFPK